MTKEKVDKIVEIIKEKLLSEKVPDDVTGKMICNLQTGGISGNVTLEIKI